jgi:multisubunit Na+/H+ antiporter MnhB subunit
MKDDLPTKDTNKTMNSLLPKRSDKQKKYLRFGAMIGTSMVLMYLVMYANTYQLSHVQWSETRFFMTLLMGATMAVVMLAFMLGMYKNPTANIAIAMGSVALFALGTFLVRSQTTVGDESWMSGMIPHHSIAILTSENAEIEDVRVCNLAKNIIEAQKREIDEMQWLIDDINQNGPAATSVKANSRPVPEYAGEAMRSCD